MSKRVINLPEATCLRAEVFPTIVKIIDPNREEQIGKLTLDEAEIFAKELLVACYAVRNNQSLAIAGPQLEGSILGRYINGKFVPIK